MGEYMILNPKRRGRKAKRSSARRTKKRRSKKRRTSSVSRRAANRRRRRTTSRRAFGGLRLPSIAGLNLGSAVAGAVGVVAAEGLTNFAQRFVPVSQVQSGPGRIVLKVGVSAVTLMLVKRFAGKALASQLATGMGISAALDTYKLVSASVPGMPALNGLDEIVPTLSGYGGNDDDETVAGLGALAEPAFATPW